MRIAVAHARRHLATCSHCSFICSRAIRTEHISQLHACNYMFVKNHGHDEIGAFAVSHLIRRFTNHQKNIWKSCSFSTRVISIHGDKPSAEYAKSRRASLESEFGHALGDHDSKTLSTFFRFGPFLALYRAAIILSEVAVLSLSHFLVKDIYKRAVLFRRTLIRLGPFYIKLGQALSTRPDILPKAYCQELVKLQDQIPPFPTEVAMKSIESQLGAPISKLFADISSEPIAAASLGQVYKGHLHSGELVAVKVQRPGIALSLALDAHLIHMIGGQLKLFAKARGDLLAAVNELVRHMFEEIDYVLEGRNAERFASLYGFNLDYESSSKCHRLGRDFDKKGKQALSNAYGSRTKRWVKVPKIYWDFTRKAVLTMEWIDGIKLTDQEGLKEAKLNIQQLIDQGVYCSLRQLLEEGFFHADPHPGNLVAIKEGSLAYFDFGMMGDIPRHYRVGLIRTLVHFVNRDSLGLANDFLSLGFIAEGVDIQPIADSLQASFGDEATKSHLDFQGIMNQLSNVMYEYNFSLPPDYALVIRALGSLEGTAKTLDPDFKVVSSAYPFIIGRLLADPDPDMRKILRELLIRNNGSIRWHRLERLVMAIAEQTSVTEKERQSSVSENDMGQTSVQGWSLAFDIRAVAAATADLFDFILSGKGARVRVLLARDIVEALDAFLQQDVFGYLYPEKRKGTEGSGASEEKQQSNNENSTQKQWVRDDQDEKRRASLSQYSIFKGQSNSEFTSRSSNYQSVEGHKNSENIESQSSETVSVINEDSGPKDDQKHIFVMRVIAALHAFAKAVKAAPEVWIPLLFRIAMRPEMHKFSLYVLDASARTSCQRIREVVWLNISKALHESTKQDNSPSQVH